MTIDDAAKIAISLPEVQEGTRFRNRTWFVAGKGFAWERPLSKADVRRLGGRPAPAGQLLAVMVASLEEKEVLMMDPPRGFFDIEHFSGFPAVLIQLDLVEPKLLRAAIIEAWSVSAPPALISRLPRPPALRRDRVRSARPGPRPPAE